MFKKLTFLKIKDKFKNILESFIYYSIGLRQYDHIFTHLTRSEKIVLHQLARKDRKAKNFVEIGSYLGASACIIASAIKKRPSAFLYCIDTWQNQAMSEGKRETFSLFLNNISSFKKQIFTLKGFSNQQVDYFAEHNIKIDFLFIDGDHTYNAVREDFLLYRKYLHPEATIILHDYGASGVRKVIDQYIKDQVKWEYILPNMYCCQLRNLP